LAYQKQGFNNHNPLIAIAFPVGLWVRDLHDAITKQVAPARTPTNNRLRDFSSHGPSGNIDMTQENRQEASKGCEVLAAFEEPNFECK
jgi:hypothetical protein